MGEFGSWVFWKWNPVFVLIFHLWENFCHWQFKGHAANIMSICCYAGIYGFIELGQKLCGGLRCSGAGGEVKEEGKETEKANCRFGVRMENQALFLFPSTYGPCFGLYIKNLRGDPWPGSSDWHDFGCLTLSSIWPCVPEVQGSPPGSSKLTQCVKPGMTPCSAKLCCLNVLLFSTCLHLLLIRLLSCLFFFVGYFKFYLSFSSLYGVWQMFLPLNSLVPLCLNPTPVHGNHFSPILLCLLFFSDIFFLSVGQDLSVWSSLSLSLSPNPSLSVSLPAVKDVSVQLSQIMFACPAVKTGGVSLSFHLTYYERRSEGGGL